jgi:hypothetical protein
MFLRIQMVHRPGQKAGEWCATYQDMNFPNLAGKLTAVQITVCTSGRGLWPVLLPLPGSLALVCFGLGSTEDCNVGCMVW